MTTTTLLSVHQNEDTHLVDTDGRTIVQVTLGDEDTVKDILKKNKDWVVSEQVNDTYILFNEKTFAYKMVYPSRKVEEEEIPEKDLITATRIFSSFTGVRFYLSTDS